MPSPRVYRISPEDEINEVLRVVTATSGGTLSLVLPPEGTLFRNEVNLRLLVTYAREAGVDISLVTEDSVTRRRAAKYGVPVHATPDGPIPKRVLDDPPSNDSTRSDDRGETQAQPWPRRLAALLVVAGALIGLFFTLTPKVHIAVAPEYEHMQFTKIVELQGEVASLLQTMESTVTASASLPTAGTQRIGVTPATGVVVLLNAGEEAQLVPAGTELSTQTGMLFRTIEDVAIPGREVSFFLDVPVGVQSGRAEVHVSAVEPGSDGNVAAERIRVIHGDWPEITVRNLEPLVGGTDMTVPAVTATDFENVTALITESLLQERDHYVERFVREHTGRYVIATEWIDQGNIRFSHSVGELSHELKGHIEAELQLSWINFTDFAIFVEQTIPERVPIGYTWERTMGFEVRVEGYDGKQKVLRLQAEVPLRPIIDRVELAQSVAGQPVREAIAQLKSQHGIASAVIYPERTERLPTWAPWIRIHVEEEANQP